MKLECGCPKKDKRSMCINQSHLFTKPKDIYIKCGKYPAETAQTICEFCLGISENSKENECKCECHELEFKSPFAVCTLCSHCLPTKELCKCPCHQEGAMSYQYGFHMRGFCCDNPHFLSNKETPELETASCDYCGLTHTHIKGCTPKESNDLKGAREFYQSQVPPKEECICEGRVEGQDHNADCPTVCTSPEEKEELPNIKTTLQVGLQKFELRSDILDEIIKKIQFFWWQNKLPIALSDELCEALKKENT